MNNDEPIKQNTEEQELAPQVNESNGSASSPQADLEKVEQERDEYLNGWKRAKADFINYQKDETKRLRDAIGYGSENMMRDLIPVLDSFALAAMAGKDDEGMKAIQSQLKDVLKRHGLEKMAVSPGDAFDVTVHESLGEMESDKPSGTVAAEVEAGYLLNGKVIRPARVKLAK
ncbi:nucleotide exchange factor GrpE [Patescibacteria group bacterium]|nr:nucleotide exchange factor GrpE [Patescibacteria group bacterium]